MITFLKELLLDLTITALFGLCIHFGLQAAGHDEVWAVETALGYVVDTLGVYHEPDRQQGRYLN